MTHHGPVLNSDRADTDDGERLAGLVSRAGVGGTLVLSGAGLSTESGIPDYRGPTGARRRHAPMTYQLFTGDPAARHRYWARSYLGWRAIDSARPNAGHRAVTDLQQAGLLTAVITQNVDGLHRAAGAREVVELHGGLDRVVCLVCRRTESRLEVDGRLRAVNPGFDERLTSGTKVNPDGDVELPDSELDRFVMVSCRFCRSAMLKPDVVFFGENVPRERVEDCFALVATSRLILVLGSSLTVMSGLRFVRRAAALGIGVAIVNQGTTRADEIATLRLDAPLGSALPALVRSLGLTGAAELTGAADRTALSERASG